MSTRKELGAENVWTKRIRNSAHPWRGLNRSHVGIRHGNDNEGRRRRDGVTWSCRNLLHNLFNSNIIGAWYLRLTLRYHEYSLTGCETVKFGIGTNVSKEPSPFYCKITLKRRYFSTTHLKTPFYSLSEVISTGALIIYSAFGKYLRKNGNTMKQCISSL